MVRKVYMVSGGVSKFVKARKDKTFQAIVKEAYDYALSDLKKTRKEVHDMIDGSVASYFSDHFTRQLMAGIMAQDYLGLIPRPSHRVEGGGATGGLGFQAAWREVASERMDLVVAYGFETMSHVNTWKGNEFIALASDVSFDYPVGGFYSGFYASMVSRHMKEFGTTVEQMAAVSVKNHMNAIYNPYSQQPAKLTIQDVRNSPMVAWPLTRLDICAMSDGAATVLFAPEELAFELTDRPIEIIAVGTGTDAMRMADRPHKDVLLLPNEKPEDYIGDKFEGGKLKYPGIHSFRAGRMASKMAYQQANITDPVKELDFVELHDAYTSSELQTVEDMGLCKYGESGRFTMEGHPFMPNIDYGLELPNQGTIPVNPSGGLLACGHPVGATGLMQGVFAFWQLQGSTPRHFQKAGLDSKKSKVLQLENPKRGAIHSHAGTGTYVTVSILEKPNEVQMEVF
ncbi:MAG: thiolase C-terminal domain-containing protein [Candidatus Hodarchaeales archaeon]|jgi:acetyl-CoA C-acetyltransferase